MAAAGRPNAEATQTLAADLSLLDDDAFSLAGLALALHHSGDAAGAAALLQVLEETAVSDGGYVHWSGARQDGYYRQKTMSSDVRNTALALSALVRIAPGRALEPGVVRWLMAQRRDQGWGSTNETAFAVIALSDHLLAAGYNQAATSPYTVLLNGEEIESGTLAQGDPAIRIELPASQLESGENQLVITTRENDRLYYTINNRLYLSQQPIAAAGRIAVRRVYRDPASGARLESVVAGQLVEVELRVDMPQPGTYMIVEDRLPGGLEALNENLNTTSHVGGYYEEESFYRWRQLGYNYKEIRGDRVSFFITDLAKGEGTFTYYARAAHAGTFSALPAAAAAMYDAGLWGRSASDTITISEAP
jgi:hypothetical protein